MGILINLLVSGVVVLISAYIIPGVKVDGFFTAVVVAVVLALVNAFIEPIVLFLTLPINILTLGLFTIVVEALMVMIVAAVVPGFLVCGWISAILFAIVLSLINSILFGMAPKKKGKR